LVGIAQSEIPEKRYPNGGEFSSRGEENHDPGGGVRGDQASRPAGNPGCGPGVAGHR
jgi:hypothetical protein